MFDNFTIYFENFNVLLTLGLSTATLSGDGRHSQVNKSSEKEQRVVVRKRVVNEKHLDDDTMVRLCRGAADE